MYKTAGRHRRYYSIVTHCLGLIFLVGPMWVGAQEVQVGRYATLRPVPTPEQANLLSALVTVRFPETVINVGQAMEHLLQPSGYRLASEAVEEPSREMLLNLPLPKPHRALGPMPLQTALETLAGPAFRLIEDPVHRLLTFERCSPIESRSIRMSNSEAR